MAFHVACPITCRRICYCDLGFPKGLKSERTRVDFLDEISRVEEFLKDPWILRAGGGEDGSAATVQVPVPRLVPPPAGPLPEDDGGDEAAAAAAVASSAKARRYALQRQAAAASQAAEDYVRRLESGMGLELQGEVAGELAPEDQGSSAVKVMCRICFSGENEGSEKAIKMLSCKMCSKKYHRTCLKIWAEYRDLFHWSSWACPSCRTCEVCRRTGDPTKLMYCKRCDDAYHCYCQQPPHKNVSHGPYLCPKHTRCHSCGSTVPGSGLSTRWFLGYTCCDACGRLFVKGKYCPVCLKVYRDSELTPMVCCDVCQQWVHCVCDGISDEKYQQFQADGNLYYKCAACRGNCYQVKDIDDAVRELWRRRDKADCNLIASLRSAAGLPCEEEIFSISPYSDDEESGPIILKNDYGRSLKFSVKGLTDKTTKITKEYGKNFPQTSSSNKKCSKKGHRVQSSGRPEEPYQIIEKQQELSTLEGNFREQNYANTNLSTADGQGFVSSPVARSSGSDRERPVFDQPESNSFFKEDGKSHITKVSKVKIKGSKPQGSHFKEGAAENVGKHETTKGTKLVIHLGAKNRNATASPRSEASSCHREQEFAATNGSGDTSKQNKDCENYVLELHAGTDRTERGAKLDNATHTSSKYEDKTVLKLRKASRANLAEESELATHKSPLILRKRSREVDPATATAQENDEGLPGQQTVVPPTNLPSQIHDASELPPASNLSIDPKPLLKLKFKNPYFEQRSSWAPQGVDEKNAVKGQRSKRKRPSLEKLAGIHEDDSLKQLHQENTVDEVMDANWILQKLGKDAVGKRVEVHQSSDNSWQKGVVSDAVEGSSSMSVQLDDGRSKTLELGKQGVRFIAQKQKRTKAPRDAS